MPKIHPIMLSVSEVAKCIGVSTRTVRRALLTETLPYIVVSDRYRITLADALAWAHASPSLAKKLSTQGFGAFVAVWKTQK